MTHGNPTGDAVRRLTDRLAARCPSNGSRSLFQFLPLGLFALLVSPALAFEGEQPRRPSGGEPVAAQIEFYIEADGRPMAGESYKIEVARDKDFENVVATFDGSKERAGWMMADPEAVQSAPPELRPAEFEGIHLRAPRKLGDGEYFWRAFKSTDGTSWNQIGGVEEFTVDTQPPAGVDTLRARRLGDGSVELSWSPVGFSVDQQPERVAGYRIYRYEKLLKRYPPMTRYLVKELENDTSAQIATPNSTARIIFFRVVAVDEVGNEDGRNRPQPIGSLDVAFNPPDLDRLTDPAVLREMYEEARQAEGRTK